MRRRHDDSADKIAALAGLSSVGNKRETNGSVKDEESATRASWEISDNQLPRCSNTAPTA